MSPFPYSFVSERISLALSNTCLSILDNVTTVSLVEGPASLKMGTMEAQTPSPLIRDHNAAKMCTTIRR